MLDDETELVGRLRKGDPSAYHLLVDRYAKRLFGLAYSMIGNADDAEEIVQETLTGVFRGIKAFERRSSLWTWLARITARQAAKSRRSAASRYRLISGVMVDEQGSGKADGSSVTTGSGSGGVDAKADLAAALAQLSSEHREIVVLRELQQMSYKEISQVLSVPMGTVESRLARARAELRTLLADWETNG